jgi:hypothetical protein
MRKRARRWTAVAWSILPLLALFAGPLDGAKRWLA